MPTSFLKKSQDFAKIAMIRVDSWLDQRLRRNPLVPVLGSGIAGILFLDGQGIVPVLIFLLPLLAMLPALLRRDRKVLPIAAASVFGLLVFAGIHASNLRSIHSFPLAGTLGAGESIEIEGTGWVSSRALPGARSISATLELTSLHLKGTTIPCRHRVPVWIQNPGLTVEYGNRVRFSGLLRPLESASAPGGFDPRAFYFRNSGSLARLEIRSGDSLSILPGNEGSPLIAYSQRLRDRMEKALFLGLAENDESYARLIAAMSLGARENSPEELEEHFRRSGTMHIFAVSGLHVGIVAGLLLAVALSLRIPKRYAVLLVIPLVLFYAVLTGLRPSAVRAAIMLSVLLAAFALKERPGLVNSLALAGLLILSWNTQQLFLPGFQLSFAVLLSIALFANPVRKGLAGPWLSDPYIPKTLLKPLQRWKDHLVQAFTALLALSVVSWLGSLGLLTWHFQSFSPVGVLANLFLVPLAGAIVTFAAASLAAFGLHLGWLSGILNQLNVGIAIVLTGAAQFFGALPGAHRHSGELLRSSSTKSTVTIDVMGERGEAAALLSFPAGRSSSASFWMIDSGGPRTYQRQMLPTLRSRGINHIDGIILSHGDIGHIGAVPEVLTHFRPPILFEPAADNRSSVYPQICSLSESLDVTRHALAAGQRIQMDEGSPVQISVLAPSGHNSGRIADDRVLVIKIRVYDWNILMTSDAGFGTEKLLLESGVNLKSDLWIRGQHLEHPSGLPRFVEAVDPAIVLTSHSDFPSSQSVPESLQKQIAETGAQLHRLDRTGVVTVEIGENQIRLYSHRKNKIVSERKKP